MATHGKFGPFNPKSEPWACYSERLRYYFTSNEIADPKKHAILLTVIGPQTFQLLRNLVQPKKLEDFSYDQLIEILTKHYDPAPSQIMQRYKFHTRERGPSESIANYVAELKSIGGLCGFQDTLPDMLRDRLVCGVNDGRIQRALLQEHNLTFERALEIAQSIEAAANDMQRLKIQPSPYIAYTRNKHLPPHRLLPATDVDPQIISKPCVVSDQLRAEPVERKAILPRFAAASSSSRGHRPTLDHNKRQSI